MENLRYLTLYDNSSSFHPRDKESRFIAPRVCSFVPRHRGPTTAILLSFRLVITSIGQCLSKYRSHPPSPLSNIRFDRSEKKEKRSIPIDLRGGEIRFYRSSRKTGVIRPIHERAEESNPWRGREQAGIAGLARSLPEAENLGRIAGGFRRRGGGEGRARDEMEKEERRKKR